MEFVASEPGVYACRVETGNDALPVAECVATVRTER